MRYLRVLLCLIVIIVVMPSVINASSLVEVRDELASKLALDTDQNGLDIGDIVRHIMQADESIEREDILNWMRKIDPVQRVDLTAFYTMYDTANGLLAQGNSGSQEDYNNLGMAYETASAILDQASLKQRQVDEHTLTLANAMIAYNDSIVPEPLAFITPETNYINSLSSDFYYFDVTGGVGPYVFELIEPLPNGFVFEQAFEHASVRWSFGLPQGEYSFTLKVTDRLGEQVTQTFTLNALFFERIYDLVVFPGIGQAEFEFPAPIAASHVVMQQSTDQGATWQDVPDDRISALNTSSTSAVVTSLENGVTYQFRLKVTGGVNDGFSDAVSVQPNKLLATSGDSSVILQFGPQPQANATIQQSDTGGLYWTDIEDLQIDPETTSVTISGLTNGKLYMYRLLVNGDVYSNEAIAVPMVPSSGSHGLALRTPDSAFVSFDPEIGFTSFWYELNGDDHRIDATLGSVIYNHSTFVEIVDLTGNDKYKVVGSAGISLFPSVATIEPVITLSTIFDDEVVTVTPSAPLTFGKTGRLQKLQEGQYEWVDIGTITNNIPFIDDTIAEEGIYHYRMLISSPTYFELTETSSVEVVLP